MARQGLKLRTIETPITVSNVHRDDNVRSKLPWLIEMAPIARLRPAKRNARTHSKKQIAKIAKSIEAFGVVAPAVIDGHERIVAGHARIEAAKQSGLKQYPVIRLTHLSDEQLRALALADNKLASEAGWDKELLSAEFADLLVELPALDLDIEITGFEPGEVDAIITDFEESEVDPSDDIPEINEKNAAARDDDIFILGRHRLYVGDARNQASYDRLLQGKVAEMAFLDPPYNVKVDGHVGGRGRIKHREFAYASGEMTTGQFVRFLRDALELSVNYTVDGGIHYVCMDWRHAYELMQAGAPIYSELKNICVWTKTNAGQGSFYRNQHELVFVYKCGKEPHLNTFELGQHGRSRTNIWRYPGANTFRAGRMDDLKMHPTVKPVAMIADAMRDCSRRGSTILDVFSGSGSTLIAAEQVGRRAYCMEIDPTYADVTIKRWQKLTGKDAILESSGKTFDELTRQRS